MSLVMPPYFPPGPGSIGGSYGCGSQCVSTWSAAQLSLAAAWTEFISSGMLGLHEDWLCTGMDRIHIQWHIRIPRGPVMHVSIKAAIYRVWRLRSDFCWTVLIPVMCLIHLNTPSASCLYVRSGSGGWIRSPLVAAAQLLAACFFHLSCSYFH